MRRGIAAEYGDADALLATARAAVARGFTRVEAYTPVPVPALDEVLGARRSRLPLVAGAAAVLGAAGGYALEWLLVAYLYPLDVGGRPPHMPLPFLLIAIEMGFLAGAIAVVAGLVVRARLATLWDPIFDVPGIESASAGGYWLAVSADDPRWREAELTELFAGATQVHGFGGPA